MEVGQQIRYAVRKLVRAPLFALTAVGTLALGIGANATIFTVVHAVLIKPLPFERPEELAGLWHTAPGLDFERVNQSPAMYWTYFRWAHDAGSMILDQLLHGLSCLAAQ